MGDRERQAKRAIGEAAGQWRDGRLDRRDFLRTCARLGVGFSAAGLASLWGGRRIGLLNWNADIAHAAERSVTDWLRDVGRPLRGTTVKVVSEATPPSRAIYSLAQQEFMPATGINIQWELLPLDQVLQKVSIDAAGGLGDNDIYYLDQAWTARFAQDTIDPREMWDAKPDLRMPNYDWDDFLKPLVDNIAMYKGKMVGIVCDIPIFIMMYRKDIFERLGLPVPTTLAQYLDVVKEANRLAPETYGTVGQWKSGHYSLETDWTAWLWAHGGSVFNNRGECVVNDERGLAALEYMMRLKPYMPPGVTTWDWSGEAEAVAQGKAAIYISWGEFFPLYDTPEKSKVVGLMEAADCPKEIALRTRAETGFLETPGISHQGGSVYALSRYSRRQTAAWVFLQWATSSDVQTRAAILGGGASPVRQSTFDDPRTKEAARVGPGTTRHFAVTERAIKQRMGTEPHLPAWPEIANDVFAVELGRLVTGEYRSVKQAADIMKRRADQVVGIYRS